MRPQIHLGVWQDTKALPCFTPMTGVYHPGQAINSRIRREPSLITAASCRCAHFKQARKQAGF